MERGEINRHPDLFVGRVTLEEARNLGAPFYSVIYYIGKIRANLAILIERNRTRTVKLPDRLTTEGEMTREALKKFRKKAI